MNYQEKYFKYKNKYLKLKKLIGGANTLPELQAECTSQKSNLPPDLNCPSCYTNYILQNNDITLNSIRMCNNHEFNEKYFNNTILINPQKYNFNTNNFEPCLPTEVSLLNPINYRNVHDDNLRNPINPLRKNDNISTFCAEGNIVFTNQNSIIGSTAINSCMFVIILLGNGEKICIHHNAFDNDYNPNIINATNLERLLNELKTNPGYSDFLNFDVNKNLKCIILTEQFTAYSTISSKYYEILNNNINFDKINVINTTPNETFHIIVDNNNNIFKFT